MDCPVGGVAALSNKLAVYQNRLLLNQLTKKRVAAGGVLAIVAVFSLACPRDVPVEKEMFWTCLERGSQRAPDELTLELRFVEATAHIIYIVGASAAERCGELSKTRQNTVRVVFNVRGNYWMRNYWTRPLSVAGKPLTSHNDFLGRSHQGPDTEPDPLAGTFATLTWK